jgi:hypothetical protein
VTGLDTSDTPERSPDIPVTGQTGGSAAGAMRGTRPSDIVGWVVLVAILLFAVLQASQMLGFAALTALISQFIVSAWNILFGLIIFGIGLWLSTAAYRMIRNTGANNANILATAARVAILVFAAALALRQMGIAESIVNLAFGLMLGAVAVAAAIAFGIGGRDIAGQMLERWRNQVRDSANRPNPPIPQTGGGTDIMPPSSHQGPSSDYPSQPSDHPDDFGPASDENLGTSSDL